MTALQEPEIDEQSIDALDGAPTARGGAIEILRRGVASSPELTAGLRATVLMGLGVAVSRLVIPVLLQRTIDGGILAEGGVDTGAVLRSAALIAVIFAYVLLTRHRLGFAIRVTGDAPRAAAFSWTLDLVISGTQARAAAAPTGWAE